MRFLEFYEIPGITINRRLFVIQKLASSAKKAKSDHISPGGQSYGSPLSFQSYPITGQSTAEAILPQETALAIQSIVAGSTIEPTPEALQGYIAHLEEELRNTDFRLQFVYHERTSTSALLAEARRQAGRLQG